MMFSENALNVLAAKTYRGIGRKWINDNLRGGMSEGEIVAKLNAKGIDETVRGFALAKETVRRKIESLGATIDGVAGLGDPDFPLINAKVKAADRPVALFYRGDLGLIKTSSRNIAVIGVLNPDEMIRQDEAKVVAELVKQGYCIVSGLALGCDTVGHETTLSCGGKTVAFLSSPLSEINPPSNRGLADAIVANGGLLVSEYYEKAHSRSEFLGRYPERDRIQAMFACCVVLAASYAPNRLGNDCGSRFAMDKAFEYGVRRVVIMNKDHSAGNPMYDLNRAEIAKGAVSLNPQSFKSVDVVGLQRSFLTQDCLAI